MRTLSATLKAAQQANSIDALEQRKQSLFQEALKLEGEIRALGRLVKEDSKTQES